MKTPQGKPKPSETPVVREGNVLPLLRSPPEPVFDKDWFYEEEAFFTEWMDDFD